MAEAKYQGILLAVYLYMSVILIFLIGYQLLRRSSICTVL